MFKKTITWIDLNDQERTTELYFHLSKLDLGEFQQKLVKWQVQFQNAMKADDLAKGMQVWTEIVRFGIGIKSEDGSRFVKTDAVKDDLMESPAVEELIYGFVLNPSDALDFVTALLPKELSDKFAELMKADPDIAELVKKPAAVEDNRPAWEKEGRMPTKAEFATMSPDQQKAAFAKALGAK
jgi:hypothetical protein